MLCLGAGDMLNGGDNQHLVDGILKSVQNLSNILGKDTPKSILYAVAYKKNIEDYKGYLGNEAYREKSNIVNY